MAQTVSVVVGDRNRPQKHIQQGLTPCKPMVCIRRATLAGDRRLGGLAENLFCSTPEISVLAIQGAAPIITGRVTVTIEYLVSDPLAA